MRILLIMDMSWLELINNPWVITIFGGIPSAIFVGWFSSKFISKNGGSQYLNKVENGNTEVLNSLRSLIPEPTFPETEAVNSVIAATARRNGVKKEDMLSPMQFFDELIKEVVDSTFVTNKKKLDYCKRLCVLKREALLYAQPSTYAELAARREDEDEKFSTFVSISSGVMVIIITMILLFTRESYQFLGTTLSISILPIAVAGTLAMMYLIVSVSRFHDSKDLFDTSDLITDFGHSTVRKKRNER